MRDIQVFESLIKQLQSEGNSPEEISDKLRIAHEFLYKGLGEQAKIDRLYYILKCIYSDEPGREIIRPAYDRLWKILENRGLNPTEFLGDHDAHSFDRAWSERWRIRNKQRNT